MPDIVDMDMEKSTIIVNAINFENGYDTVIDITTPHRFILSQE